MPCRIIYGEFIESQIKQEKNHMNKRHHAAHPNTTVKPSPINLKPEAYAPKASAFGPSLSPLPGSATHDPSATAEHTTFGKGTTTEAVLTNNNPSEGQVGLDSRNQRLGKLGSDHLS